MQEYLVEYVDMFKRWSDFEGKSNVREFWMAVLINLVVTILLSIVGAIISTTILGSLYGLVVIIPAIALSIRRMHDVGRSGWYLLWWFLPIIGWILVIIALVQPSK